MTGRAHARRRPCRTVPTKCHLRDVTTGHAVAKRQAIVILREVAGSTPAVGKGVDPATPLRCAQDDGPPSPHAATTAWDPRAPRAKSGRFASKDAHRDVAAGRR